MRTLALIVLIAACSSQKAPPPTRTKVRPFGVLAKVYIGMPRDAVIKAAPELKPGVVPNLLTFEADRDHRYDVHFDDAGLVMGVEITDPRSASDFVKAWGPGLVSRTEANERSWPAGTMFATARSLSNGLTQVDFIPMNSLDVTLGFGSELGPFGVQVLGSKGDQVDNALRPYGGITVEGDWNIVANAPRCEVGTLAFKYLRPTTNGVKADTITAINFAMQFDVKGAKAMILPVLEKKWGKPTVDGDIYTYTVRGTRLSGVIIDESLSLTAP